MKEVKPLIKTITNIVRHRGDKFCPPFVPAKITLYRNSRRSGDKFVPARKRAESAAAPGNMGLGDVFSILSPNPPILYIHSLFFILSLHRVRKKGQILSPMSINAVTAPFPATYECPFICPFKSGKWLSHAVCGHGDKFLGFCPLRLFLSPHPRKSPWLSHFPRGQNR